jgi:hypothetical protein
MARFPLPTPVDLQRRASEMPERENKPDPAETDASFDPEAVRDQPLTAADAAVARVTERLCILYFLRVAKILAKQFDGDLARATIGYEIMAANIGYIDRDPNLAGQFSTLDSAPPDDVRRPTSILAVASALEMPYETVRRHVNDLVETGRIERVKGGIIVPVREGGDPKYDPDTLHLIHWTRRLYRDLKRAGFEFD